MIRFSCAFCNKFFSVDDSKAGLSSKCPGCQKKIVVPDPKKDVVKEFDEVEVVGDFDEVEVVEEFDEVEVVEDPKPVQKPVPKPALSKPAEKPKRPAVSSPPVHSKPPTLPTKSKKVVEASEEESQNEPAEAVIKKSKGKKQSAGKSLKGGSAERGKAIIAAVGFILLGFQFYSIVITILATSIAELDGIKANLELSPLEKQIAEIEAAHKAFDDDWRIKVDADNQKKEKDPKVMQDLLNAKNEEGRKYRERISALKLSASSARQVLLEIKTLSDQRFKSLITDLPIFGVTLGLVVGSFLRLTWAQYILGGLLTLLALYQLIIFVRVMVILLSDPSLLTIVVIIRSIFGVGFSAGVPLTMGALLLKSQDVEAYMSKRVLKAIRDSV